MRADRICRAPPLPSQVLRVHSWLQWPHRVILPTNLRRRPAASMRRSVGSSRCWQLPSTTLQTSPGAPAMPMDMLLAAPKAIWLARKMQEPRHRSSIRRPILAPIPACSENWKRSWLQHSSAMPDWSEPSPRPGRLWARRSTTSVPLWVRCRLRHAQVSIAGFQLGLSGLNRRGLCWNRKHGNGSLASGPRRTPLRTAPPFPATGSDTRLRPTVR
jgi:hypothetical protein